MGRVVSVSAIEGTCSELETVFAHDCQHGHDMEMLSSRCGVLEGRGGKHKPWHPAVVQMFFAQCLLQAYTDAFSVSRRVWWSRCIARKSQVCRKPLLGQAPSACDLRRLEIYSGGVLDSECSYCGLRYGWWDGVPICSLQFC